MGHGNGSGLTEEHVREQDSYQDSLSLRDDPDTWLGLRVLLWLAVVVLIWPAALVGAVFAHWLWRLAQLGWWLG